MKRYAIIGFGCAGYNAAREIRKKDPQGEIVVYSETADPPFNPMLSTYYVSERINREGVFPFGNLNEIRNKLHLDIRSGVRVKHIDVRGRTVIPENDVRESFDAILLATGANAFVPPALKRDGGEYFVMRTLEDAMRLHDHLEKKQVRNAVVVGGSMVGIKVAELLYRRGIETVIVDGAAYLFPLAAYESVAARMEQKLRDIGIRLIFNAAVKGIFPENVVLEDGRQLQTDLICLCIGVKPNLQMLPNTHIVEEENIVVHKGIVVDDRMRTSVPGIYAAGDCCEGIDLQSGNTMIIGLWANAAAQGSCAGKNMAGDEEHYYGNILHNITHFFDMDFIGLGDIRLPGTRRSFQTQDFYIETVKDGDRLNSINILGNYKISGMLKNYLMKCTQGYTGKLSRVQRELLVRQGIDGDFLDFLEGDANE